MKPVTNHFNFPTIDSINRFLNPYNKPILLTTAASVQATTAFFFFTGQVIGTILGGVTCIPLAVFYLTLKTDQKKSIVNADLETVFYPTLKTDQKKSILEADPEWDIPSDTQIAKKTTPRPSNGFKTFQEEDDVFDDEDSLLDNAEPIDNAEQKKECGPCEETRKRVIIPNNPCRRKVIENFIRAWCPILITRTPVLEDQ